MKKSINEVVNELQDFVKMYDTIFTFDNYGIIDDTTEIEIELLETMIEFIRNSHIESITAFISDVSPTLAGFPMVKDQMGKVVNK